MPEDIKLIEDGAKFLLDSGLLFEINRSILHPLGLAMAVEVDASNNYRVASYLWDYRDDPEGLLFDPDTFIQANAKWNKFMSDFGFDKHKQRIEVLGYLIQDLENIEEDKNDEEHIRRTETD